MEIGIRCRIREKVMGSVMVRNGLDFFLRLSGCCICLYRFFILGISF